MKNSLRVTRRDFLRTSAVAGTGLVIGFYLPSSKEALAESAQAFQPNAWLQIDPAGAVTIWVAKSEMGQGVRTSLPMLVAEELEADWSKVRIEPALFDPKYGSQLTAGSTSVRTSWEPLRKAGATARQMLIAAAAQNWGVAADTCHAENGFVIHSASGRRASYGSLAEKAGKLPVPADVALKDPKDFRLIGKSTLRLDTPQKVDGSAQFGLDVRLPGMLYASVARCPVFGGKVARFDAAKAKAVAGVKDVVPISSGVAVVADSVWTAMQGRRALEITWDEGRNASLSSAAISKMLEEFSAKPGATARQDGDPTGALGSAPRRLDAVYEVPFLAHATMEPMNCTAYVRKDSCEIWAPTQMPDSNAQAAAKITGLPPSAIKVHITLLGGGFGRRAQWDFAAEAVEVSKAVGTPVKVVWSREDDIQHDLYRPASRHVLSAAIDQQGRLTAWTHKLVAPSISAQMMGRSLKDDLDEGAVDGAKDLPYEVPNLRVDYVMANTSVPVWYWRSVYASQNAYANECFLDEIAAAMKKDPYELRLELLSRSPRHRGVLELAASKAGWGKPLPAGHFRGIAVHKSFRTWVAEVAEVSMQPDGTPRVHRVVCAVDCGLVVNPNTVEAQMQSGIIYGLSAALKGRITVDKGRVQQSNFNNYPILRMSEAPQIEVHIVPSKEPPTGVGEPGLPPIAPAVMNAVFAATGKPVRRLPLAT